MDSTTAISVAVITAVGGIIVAFVNRGRVENKKDHAQVIKRLDEVSEHITALSKLTVGHLRWHERQKKKPPQKSGRK